MERGNRLFALRDGNYFFSSDQTSSIPSPNVESINKYVRHPTLHNSIYLKALPVNLKQGVKTIVRLEPEEPL